MGGEEGGRGVVEAEAEEIERIGIFSGKGGGVLTVVLDEIVVCFCRVEVGEDGAEDGARD